MKHWWEQDWVAIITALAALVAAWRGNVAAKRIKNHEARAENRARRIMGECNEEETT